MWLLLPSLASILSNLFWISWSSNLSINVSMSELGYNVKLFDLWYLLISCLLLSTK